MNMNLLL